MRTSTHVLRIILLPLLAMGTVGSLMAVANGEFLLDRKEVWGVTTPDHFYEVWSVPVESPHPDVVAADIVLRSPSNVKIVTLEALAISGDVVQTWLDTPTAQGPPIVGDTYRNEWVPFDSHLLIMPNMVGGGNYDGITEFNDGSLELDLPALPNGTEPSIGIGGIKTKDARDAFWLNSEFQGADVPLVRVVTPRDGGDVFLTLGIFGRRLCWILSANSVFLWSSDSV